MVKIFKSYVLSVFIASTFFLSQTINVNANYLENTPSKEELSIPLMAQVKNEKSDTISTTAFHASFVSYQTENMTPLEGKVEKVFAPMTIGKGLLFTGYAMNFIGSIINWIKDIVLMFK
ncbi:hypothetical protein MNL13_01385 [Bartonella krasnovii]|uniref:Cytochrome c-type biogenesis protein DsbD, protein-disulfide reductase n=1 Tax=Bartonella krasnovii TaxID=2267275 RepID=A0ABY3VVP9_9HYPH|nr:hypothetical protein [Bartonella krasnovii]UNF29459.1 hypothetical protein MNL13_01385 [Bartonella krasnovii]UNF35817.1 hypothetical protein MNL12_01385 [Bartonella krasnovii]UNF37438.1 hypothetical protein MNL11_01390 [Bartonella krasnovii]UNF49004.1 hypothetical protein MNL04_01375 [Bartonella krasnovii]